MDYDEYFDHLIGDTADSMSDTARGTLLEAFQEGWSAPTDAQDDYLGVLRRASKEAQQAFETNIDLAETERSKKEEPTAATHLLQSHQADKLKQGFVRLGQATTGLDSLLEEEHADGPQSPLSPDHSPRIRLSATALGRAVGTFKAYFDDAENPIEAVLEEQDADDELTKEIVEYFTNGFDHAVRV